MIRNWTALAILTLAILAVFAGAPGTRSVTAGGAPVYVTTTLDNDSSDLECSLREAIYTTNYNYDYGGCVDPDGGYEQIRFMLGTGTPMINITGPQPLPLIEGPVSIVAGPDRVELHGPNLPNFDGLTITALAPGTTIRRLVTSGFTGNHIEVYADDVTINGSFIGTDATGMIDMGGIAAGIYVEGAARTTIGGPNELSETSCTGDCNLIGGHFNGVHLKSGADPVVIGNFLGTNVSGTVAIGNSYGITSEVHLAMIGGTAPGAGNLASGNSVGVHLYQGPTNPQAASFVQGNRIGVNSAGTGALPNLSDGIYIDGASNSLIGGSDPGARNIISGNLRYGIDICCGVGVIVRNNLIGTLANGVTPLGNTSHGIRIREYSGYHIIGGFAEGEPNTIAFSGGDGVRVDGDSYPAETIRNSIRGNSIHSNVGKGIETINAGNTELPPPVITNATVQGVSGTACAICEVDIFSDTENEGRIYHGTESTDAGGNWSFDDEPLVGPNITATATDGANNTSEFSAPFTLPATPTPSPSPTPSPTPSGTPTPTASPTATPTPTEPPASIQGDADCDGDVDFDDVTLVLRKAAVVDDSGPCASSAGVGTLGVDTGDANCDQAVTAIDALHILLHLTSLPQLPLPSGCPAVGDPLA